MDEQRIEELRTECVFRGIVISNSGRSWSRFRDDRDQGSEMIVITDSEVIVISFSWSPEWWSRSTWNVFHRARWRWTSNRANCFSYVPYGRLCPNCAQTVP